MKEASTFESVLGQLGTPRLRPCTNSDVRVVHQGPPTTRLNGVVATDSGPTWAAEQLWI